MNLISAENVTIEMGIRTLVDKISFGIQEGERISLVGLNGCGKSSLLAAICGALPLDGGSIAKNSSISLHWVRQKWDVDPAMTVAEFLFKGDTPVGRALIAYELLMTAMEHDESVALSPEYAACRHELDALDAWAYEGEIRAVLAGFGIHDMTAPLGTLSGGMTKKVALAQAIIEDPDLLILDEPTNHLDIDTILWLQWYLCRRTKSLLMVTHDRYFLDSVSTTIWEIDQEKLFVTQGNYERYLEKRVERVEMERRRDHRISRVLANELVWARKQPRGRGTMQKARLDRIAEMMGRTTLKEEATAEMSITGRRLGKKILEAKRLTKGFDGTPVIKEFTYTFKHNERIGLVGINGSGKTTLLNLLTGRMTPDSGVVDTGLNTHFGIFDQHSAELDPAMPIIKYMKSFAEVIQMADGSVISAGDMLERFLFAPSMHYTAIGKLSGGEKRRLHLLGVLMTNPNFLILDEPTNDLDVQTLTVLEEFLDGFAGCIVVVSHDRYFLDKVADYLFVMEEGLVTGFPGGYSDYLEWKKLKSRESELMRKAAVEVAVKPVELAAKEAPRKMSFNEKREYETILDLIDALETEKSALEGFFGEGSTDGELIKKNNQRYSELTALIAEKTARWEELAERA